MITHLSDRTLTEDQLLEVCRLEARDISRVSEACARAAHEVNRAYCIAIGDASQPSWDDAPEWQRASAIKGVRGAIEGNTPAESHAGWLAEKVAAGWVYGLTKDPEKKTHPCMVPYAELPPAQRQKDALYLSTVRAMYEALTGKPAAPLKPIIVNGASHEVTTTSLSYDDVVALADMEYFFLSVVYKQGPPENPEGCLAPGQAVAVGPGMKFSVARTGGA